jgi:hypothetical protein
VNNLLGTAPAILDTFSGLITLADPTTLPMGGSPRNQNVDFNVGSVFTRDGLENIFTYENAAVGPSPGTVAANLPGGTPWINPNAVLSNNGFFASNTIAPLTTLDLDVLEIVHFAFSVPSTATVQGFSISVEAYATIGGTLHVQMVKDGVAVGNVESIALNVGSPTTLTLGGMNDLFGESWTFADLNNTAFGIQLSAQGPPFVDPRFGGGTIFIGFTTLTCFFAPAQNNYNYVTTFEDEFGDIFTIALDSSGQFFIENVLENPGVLAPLFNGPPAGSYATGFNADSRQYLAISDLTQGNYPPQQYTGQWNDRVSQVGPGAPPTFTGITAGTDSFGIGSITQPPAESHGSSYFLQSQGPGSTTAGNVVTVYYSDSTVGIADATLVNAFNAGLAPVIIFTSFTGGPTEQGPYVQQVTSVGEGSPPGQPRQFFYYTYNLTTSAFTYFQGSGHPGFTANYQITQATLTTTVPVPGLEVGNQIQVSGSSVTNWDQTWTITQTLNSGQFTISQTSVIGGIATYSYSLITGSVPTAGQLVTITGTLNDNGTLNFVNVAIVSASGGADGTFTVNVSVPDAAAASEEGQATTAGTSFTFDPGAALVGSTTDDPIFGNATGGSLTFQGPSGQFISAGTLQGVVFFITRNGYFTHPSPAVTFSITASTVSIQASNIPIGPPNVIGRAIAFTEAGSNGVPGASFFTIPEPVQYIVDGVTFTASSLFINDNVTTTASFSFPQQTLLNDFAIDIQGQNLFNLYELGDPAWCVQYAGRTVWGRVRNQIVNFLNLSFDGGFLANPGGLLRPLGWFVNQATVPARADLTLLVSPVFGNSLFMQNNTGVTQAVMCMIYQSAFQDYLLEPILQNQTAYSVRVSVRTPSSATIGNLVIDLAPFTGGTGFGAAVGTFTLPLSSISSTMATYEGTLLTNATLTIPSNLQLRVYATNLQNNGDIEIDRINIFPTQQPTNLTAVVFSYGVDPASGDTDPESFDDATGSADTQTVNSQPANGGFVLRGNLYVVKESSLGFLSETPNQEPANWSPFEEVSNVAGACGINAYTIDKHKGEEWAAMACQNGLFLFNGGAPAPIHLEISDIWAAINWNNAEGIALCNDIANRRIYCAIPLPTPNPWMVTTEVNPTPTQPNVVLMLNYDGIGSIDNLQTASSMHITMMGKLAVQDIHRKWSLWTIPTPYIGLVKRSELNSLMLFCNGIGSSKIYQLNPVESGMDDGVPFTSSYCTYGFVDSDQAQTNPIFGTNNKRYRYVDFLINGVGTAQATFFQNTLQAKYPYHIPGGLILENPAGNDLEYPLDEFAQRLFVEVVMENGWFNLSRLSLFAAMDKWASIRGI